jgi:predicted O-methyltransferase YrrM
MGPSKFYHRLPVLGRPYRERNTAREERDRAQRENEAVAHERDEAHSQLEAALRERDEAFRAKDAAELALSEANAKLFVPPGHFYSPIVDPAEADEHLTRLERRPTATSLPDVKINREAMVDTWNAMLPFLTTLAFPEKTSEEFRYAFDNPSYSWGDASILHAMIRRQMPRRIVEIGCGWSSACIVDTVERHCNSTRLTFVDPYPGLLHTLIGKTELDHEIIELPIQRVPGAVFETLGAGDILFIDSTHVMRTGNDVCFELFEILPQLVPGTLVHFHDMFWPFEYPRRWVLEEKMSWNELYGVRAFLSNNEKWEIVFFNDYFGKIEKSLVQATYPDFLKNAGGALWLRRIC